MKDLKSFLYKDKTGMYPPREDQKADIILLGETAQSQNLQIQSLSKEVGTKAPLQALEDLVTNSKLEGTSQALIQTFESRMKELDSKITILKIELAELKASQKKTCFLKRLWSKIFK